MLVDLKEALCASGRHPELSWLATSDECDEQIVLRDYSAQVRICYACPERNTCAVDAVHNRDAHTVRAGFKLWLPQERAALASHLDRQGIDPWEI